jgi:hypothetical protein
MTPPTTASSPGPDDKSGITEIEVCGYKHFVQRTVNTITVFDEEWGHLLHQVNLGQSDAMVALVVEAYLAGWALGKKAGRADYRQELLSLLGAQPAKEEG